jgi:hypothetical protein
VPEPSACALSSAANRKAGSKRAKRRRRVFITIDVLKDVYLIFKSGSHLKNALLPVFPHGKRKFI